MRSTFVYFGFTVGLLSDLGAIFDFLVDFGICNSDFTVSSSALVSLYLFTMVRSSSIQSLTLVRRANSPSVSESKSLSCLVVSDEIFFSAASPIQLGAPLFWEIS